MFGLILFTDEHPHVVKVLRDDDYWTRFDAITGDNFAVFSAKPLPGTNHCSDPPPGKFAMMLSVWHEPAENKELLSTFHIDNTKKLPKFVVFAQMPDDSILQCSLPLTDETEAAAYKRLNEVITEVSNAAKGIADEYRGDTESVFNAFSMQVREFKERETLIKVVKWMPFINRFIKTLT